MKKYILIVYMTFLYTGIVEAQFEWKINIDNMAASYLKNNSGALAIAIVDNGKHQMFFYGKTENTKGLSPDSSTVFELGELSQVFTSILYADMVIKDVVKPDDKLQRFLPVTLPVPVYRNIVCKPVSQKDIDPLSEKEPGSFAFTGYMCFPDPASKPQEIMLCDLATQTSGFPFYPDNLKIKKHDTNPFSAYNTEDLFNFVKDYTFSNPLGYDYKNSLPGISLLGYALSQQSGKSFDELLRERVLIPFGMNATGINHPGNTKIANAAQGYTPAGVPVDMWQYDALAPAGGVYSNMSDMISFLSLNIDLNKNYNTNLLDYTHNPRIQLTGKKNKNSAVALGWMIAKPHAETNIVWRSSVTGGYAAYIGFVETSHTGVVILSSQAVEVKTMGESILKTLQKIKLN